MGEQVEKQDTIDSRCLWCKAHLDAFGEREAHWLHLKGLKGILLADCSQLGSAVTLQACKDAAKQMLYDLHHLHAKMFRRSSAGSCKCWHATQASCENLAIASDPCRRFAEHAPIRPAKCCCGQSI